MTAITLEMDLEVEQAWIEADVPESEADNTIDPTADPARVWCESSRGPARVLGGFCEHCGARDHDDI